MIPEQNAQRGALHRLDFTAEDIFQRLVPIVKSYHLSQKIVQLHILLPNKESNDALNEAINWAGTKVEDPLNEFIQWTIIFCTAFILIVRAIVWIIRKCCAKQRHPIFLEDKNLLDNNLKFRPWKRFERV